MRIFPFKNVGFLRCSSEAFLCFWWPFKLWRGRRTLRADSTEAINFEHYSPVNSVSPGVYCFVCRGGFLIFFPSSAAQLRGGRTMSSWWWDNKENGGNVSKLIREIVLLSSKVLILCVLEAGKTNIGKIKHFVFGN